MCSDIAIVAENLSKKYYLPYPVIDHTGKSTYELWALKDIHLEIKKGQSVGIIGPNGSGKSTLLKILAGITSPTTGRAEINGKVASILDIGAGFHPELSGRENIFLNGHLLGFSRREIVAKLDEIVAFSGIEKFIDEPVKTYSNGMYLRLAFSILAHLDFDVYLFDEVMSVGDAAFAFKAKRKLQSLITSDKSVLFVSHDLEELSNQDIFILLENGMMKSITTKNNILLDYLEKSIPTQSLEVTTHAVSITDFIKYPVSDDVTVNWLNFYQDRPDSTEEFRTDKEFILEISYQKKKNTDTLDLIITISNVQDHVILSSSPFVKQYFNENTRSGNYHCRCVIPAYFFHAQIYKINIFFVKNLKSKLDEKNLNIDREKEGFLFERALRLPNVIVFKPRFIKQKNLIDLSYINLTGHLLCGLEWTVDFNG